MAIFDGHISNAIGGAGGGGPSTDTLDQVFHRGSSILYGAAEALLLDAATTGHTGTAGVIDLNLNATATGVSAIDIAHNHNKAGGTTYSIRFNPTITTTGIYAGLSFAAPAGAGTATKTALSVSSGYTYAVYSNSPIALGAAGYVANSAIGVSEWQYSTGVSSGFKTGVLCLGVSAFNTTGYVGSTGSVVAAMSINQISWIGGAGISLDGSDAATLYIVSPQRITGGGASCPLIVDGALPSWFKGQLAIGSEARPVTGFADVTGYALNIDHAWAPTEETVGVASFGGTITGGINCTAYSFGAVWDPPATGGAHNFFGLTLGGDITVQPGDTINLAFGLYIPGPPSCNVVPTLSRSIHVSNGECFFGDDVILAGDFGGMGTSAYVGAAPSSGGCALGINKSVMGTGSADFAGFSGEGDIRAGAAVNMFGQLLKFTFREHSSGTINVYQQYLAAPTITDSTGTTDYAVTCYIAGAPTGVSPVSGLYSFWVDSGVSRFGGLITQTLPATMTSGDGIAVSWNAATTLTGTTCGVYVDQYTNVAPSGQVNAAYYAKVANGSSGGAVVGYEANFTSAAYSTSSAGFKVSGTSWSTIQSNFFAALTASTSASTVIRDFDSASACASVSICRFYARNGASNIQVGFYSETLTSGYGAASSNIGLYLGGANWAGVSGTVNGNYTIFGDSGSYRFECDQTQASDASAYLNAFDIPSATITWTGNTGVTMATGVNLVDIKAPTYSAALAFTMAIAATLRIGGAPIAGGAGPLTIADALAFWVDSGRSRFDGDGTHVFELPADTGGGPAYIGAIQGRIPIKIGADTRYIPYYLTA